MIDVIFLSYSKTKKLYEMTKTAIRSLIDNNTEFEFNIVVVQTEDNKFGDTEYFGGGVKVIHPNTRFHYNNFIKLAYKELSDSPVVIISNDDVYYQKGSIAELLSGTKHFMICSAKNPDSKFNRGLQSKYKTGYIKGYKTSEHFSGWCHLIVKKVFKYVSVDNFWHSNFGGYFQDNWICHLALVHNIPMGLCADSIVEHRESISSPHSPEREYFNMIQHKVFKKTKQEYAKRKKDI